MYEPGTRVVTIDVPAITPPPFQVADIPPGCRGTVIESRNVDWIRHTVTRGRADSGHSVYELRVLWDHTGAERKLYSYQVRVLSLPEQIGELG